MKNPTKSYVNGYVGAFTAIMALYLANAFLVPLVGNYDFLAAYSYLQTNYSDVLSGIVKGLPTPDPSVPLVASVAFLNPAVALVIGLPTSSGT